MLEWHPDRVILITPKGTVIVARRVYERLEARISPEDLGLLRDYDWWRLVSELISGVAFTAPAHHKEAQP